MTQPDVSPKAAGPLWRRHAVLCIKVIVTFGLLAFVLRSVDLGEVISRAASAAPLPLLLALILAIAQIFLVAQRWSIIMTSWHPRPSLLVLISFTWEGAFYNLALPSGVGGDAIRMFRCRRAGMPLRFAVGGVLLDRYVGVVVLFCLCSVSLVFPQQPLQAVIGKVGILLLTLTLPLAALVPLAVDFVPGPWRRWPAVGSVLWLCREARGLFSRARQAALVLTISVLNHVMTIACFICIGVAIGVDAPVWLYILVVPVAMVTAMIPLSLGGWGIREGAMVGLFSLAGVPTTEALTLSVLFGLVLLALGLLGGAIGLLQPERPGSLDAKQEAD